MHLVFNYNIMKTINLNIGKRGELLWKCELEKNHKIIHTAPNKKFYDYDIKAEYNGVEYTYEVKYDAKGYEYAKLYNRPVNLYIEFKNTTLNEDSGIKASIANYYVYILNNNGVETAYVFDRIKLLNHLETSNYKVRGNKVGGDNNALGWTPPLHNLTNLIRREVVL